jgi:hypothetical protein
MLYKQTNEQTPWSESTSELYRPTDLVASATPVADLISLFTDDTDHLHRQTYSQTHCTQKLEV